MRQTLPSRGKDGNRHAYWALVESYRTERGPRQHVVAYLGELDEQGRLGIQRRAETAVFGRLFLQRIIIAF